MAGKPKNRIGEVFTDGVTSLEIISISDKRTPSGGACWNGLCSCGKTRKDIPGDQLFHGKRKTRKTVCSCLDCANKKIREGVIKANESLELERQDSARKAREKLIGLVPNEWLELPLTSQEGKRLGTTQFFTGIPCSKGHLERRHTSTGLCLECKRLSSALRNSTPEQKEKNKLAAKRRWADPRQRELARAHRAEWAKKPQGKASLKNSYKKFYDNHSKRVVSEKTKRSNERYHEDPA